MKFEMSSDRGAVSIEAPGMDGSARLSAADLDGLIHKLAWLRASMAPSHALTQPTPEALRCSPSAIRWLVTEGEHRGTWALHLLHPGLGWIWMVLDQSALNDFVAGVRLFGSEPLPRWCH